MFKAEFDFNRKKIDAGFEVKKRAINADFSLNITPSITNLVTKEELKIATDTFIFEQGIATDTWVISHNLGKYPSVTIVDTADTVFLGQVEYLDENNCIVHINGATKGKAYLN